MGVCLWGGAASKEEDFFRREEQRTLAVVAIEREHFEVLCFTKGWVWRALGTDEKPAWWC